MPTRICHRNALKCVPGTGLRPHSSVTAMAAVIMIAIAVAFLGTGVVADASESQVLGALSLASARTNSSFLEITYGDSFSFKVPLDAGYVVYERNDGRGARHLCLARYNAAGMEFEAVVDMFPLDMELLSPLDILARSILVSGQKTRIVHSDKIEAAGLPGLDISMQGIAYDRYMPVGEMRVVLLTDFTMGMSFTLVEHQANAEIHRAALDDLISTVVLHQRTSADPVQ
ncbi:MAG: hypothetical protein VB144_07110 [Clostridia bacterium]|nr:hypothetical protein [Clostridia bacterium]